MNPGPELDKLIAEKVMGWKWENYSPPGLYPPQEDERSGWCVPWQDKIPNYSTNISYAWEIFEKFSLNNLTRGVDGYVCRFGIEKRNDPGPGMFTISQIDARGNTAPHAICLAALKAVGYDILSTNGQPDPNTSRTPVP